MLVTGSALVVVNAAPLLASAEVAIARTATVAAAAMSENFLMLIRFSPPYVGTKRSSGMDDERTLPDSGRRCATSCLWHLSAAYVFLTAHRLAASRVASGGVGGTSPGLGLAISWY